MPRIIQTNPDGSEVSNYLTQSASGRPFQTGAIRVLPNGKLFGYSGLVSFDLTAAATYDMINFQLDQDALFNITWMADWAGIENAGVRIGFIITIDGTTVQRVQWGEASSAGYPRQIPDSNLFVPAHKFCDIKIMNNDASASNFQINNTLLGEFI